jgi:hypothetical protein
VAAAERRASRPAIKQRGRRSTHQIAGRHAESQWPLYARQPRHAIPKPTPASVARSPLRRPAVRFVIARGDHGGERRATIASLSISLLRIFLSPLPHSVVADSSRSDDQLNRNPWNKEGFRNRYHQELLSANSRSSGDPRQDGRRHWRSTRAPAA